MNRVNFYFFVAVIFALFFFSSVSISAENYVQSFPSGLIDWTNGVVEAFGAGIPLRNAENAAKGRAVAKRNAEALARENLLELVKCISIDSKHKIKDLIQRGSISLKALRKFLMDSRLVDLSYGRDGSVKATVAFWLSGTFSELLLPKDIVTIENVQQPNRLQKKEKPFTGLVVDCRGFHVRPALVPLIMDEDGEVVYGPAYASREYAVKRGVAAYTKGLSAAKKNPRVSPYPLCVKGIKTAKKGISDIIISNADAAKIRSMASNLKLMKECKVVIALD